MRTVLWFVYFWGILLRLLPVGRRLDRLRKEGREEDYRRERDRWVAWWADRMLRNAGARIETTGRERIPAGRPAVFVCNHQGYFDIPLVLTQLDRPHPLLAKAETARIPLIRRWMERLDCVFVDREDGRDGLEALRRGGRLLKEGQSLVVFPEGTRSKGDRMGPFKGGAVQIAAKEGAPVVPVRIDGSWRLMEGNGGWIRPAAVRVTILPPVETAGLSREEKRQLPQRLARLLAGDSGEGFV